jgi:hypothetical protein
MFMVQADVQFQILDKFTSLHQFVCWCVYQLKKNRECLCVHRNVYVRIAAQYKLQSNQKHFYVRFEVFTVVTMKNAVFWDVAQSTQRHIQEDNILQKHFCLHHPEIYYTRL